MDALLPIALGTGIPAYITVGILMARVCYRRFASDWYEDMIDRCLKKWRYTEMTPEGMRSIDETFRNDGSTEVVFGALFAGAFWPVAWTWMFIFGSHPVTGLEADTRKAVENTELRRKIARIEREISDDLQDQLLEAERKNKALAKKKP